MTNTATNQTVTLESICDDKYGWIGGIATNCLAGTNAIGTVTDTNCGDVEGQTLAPGSSYSCWFTINVESYIQAIETGKVTAFGHDGNNKPVNAFDSAQVAITSVQPDASVVKSLDGIACADVNYRIKVTNTVAKPLTLTELVDDQFGTITSVHDNVLATNCLAAPSEAGTSPVVIPVAGSYECQFRAHLCGSPHVDTVTATLIDADGNAAVYKGSNPLTVNISAQ